MTVRSTVRSWNGRVQSTMDAHNGTTETLDRQVDFAELRVFDSMTLAVMLPTTCHEWGPGGGDRRRRRGPMRAATRAGQPA